MIKNARNSWASTTVNEKPFIRLALVALASCMLPISASAQDSELSFQNASSLIDNPTSGAEITQQNFARTKDADIADVNGDGFNDILDVNSNNADRNTSVILRLNDQNGGFNVIAIEDSSELVSYDGDLVDVNSDGLPDLIRATEQSVAIYLNQGEAQGFFSLNEEPDFESAMCADDIAIGDLNNDGRIDFAATQRIIGACSSNATRSLVRIFLNADSSGQFEALPDILTPVGISTHDVIFLDADNNGFTDIMVLNENTPTTQGQSQLFLSSGGNTPSFTLSQQAFSSAISAASADLNNDGLPDMVLAGATFLTELNFFGFPVVAEVIPVLELYLNNPFNPGQFTQISLNAPTGTSQYYDVEMGDIDLDGDIDFLTASVGGSVSTTLQYWQNNFFDLNEPFSNITALGGQATFPGLSGTQRLSVDVIDFDRDGDLDVYVAGGDGAAGLVTDGGGPCAGCLPNLFFENLLDPDPEPAFVIVPLAGATPIPVYPTHTLTSQ